MPTKKKIVAEVQKVIVIHQWSHSRLALFEKCKFACYLKHGLKIPEPERPLPPGKTEHANDRGTRLHDNAELFVKGKAKLAPELQRTFLPEYEMLYALYKQGKVIMEEEWAMNRDWEPVEWAAKDAWLRLKLDLMVRLSDTEAVVADLKTGRREGNEIKHAEQVQLYQLVTFLREPSLQKLHVELWYPDVDYLHQQTFTRDQGLRFLKRFNERGNTLTTYEFTGNEVDANPSVYTCKWCFYGPKGTGHCKRGV